MKRILLLLICVLLISACSKKSGFTALKEEVSEDYAYEDSFVANSKSASRSVFNDMVTSGEYEEASQTSESDSQINQEVIERKLIRKGNISVQVNSLENGAAAVEDWVKKFQGYISYSYQYSSSYQYTIRIPSDAFDQAMDSFSNIGKVQKRSITAEDVTDRYYDLKTRLETKKLLREKYNEYLKRAANVTELMEIERNLNDVISEIESMEGSLKLLTNQIDYSTITVNISVSQPVYSPSYSIKKIDFKRIGYNIINFVIQLFSAVIYIIVYGIPILALLFLFYWICFGRIGLIRKAFKRLSKKSSKKIDSK